jgi:F-type H+-transporting ATPase subunit b
MPHALTVILGAGGGEEKYGLVLPIQVETMIWAWVIFALLFLILRKLAWKPLLAAVEAREKKIADSLTRAEELQRASAEIAKKQEAVLAEAHGQAKTVLDQARADAEDFRKRELERARVDSEGFLERAKKEMALEEGRIRDELRRDVVNLTVAAASKVLGRSVTAADDRRLAEQAIAEVIKEHVGSDKN